ncbi:MAG: superoxide dismutase family protein [Myxococcales bacterium]
MLHALARSFLLVGFSGSLLMACSSDPSPGDGGSAGTSTGGSAAGNPAGGSSSSQAGTAPSAGTATSGGTASAGTASGGSSAGTSAAGSASGGGGAGGSGGANNNGGSGGAASGAGGSAGGGGGTGGGAATPTAVATITGINGIVVTGSATFTQGATMTKLVLNLTACPDGPHSSHLHLVKDCSDNGAAAGGHWVPNGEKLGDYSCASGMVTYEVSKPVSTWTVGDGSATDVTKYAFMVHETSDAMSSGARIGCGVINKQ